MRTEIKLTYYEIQSAHTRVNWAEDLILQLPEDHEGRNSWLLNYGRKAEAMSLREKFGIGWIPNTESSDVEALTSMNALPGEAIVMDRMHHDWVLLQCIDWFGTPIPAGTIYHQKTADYYDPHINGAECPSLRVNFYTVKNNPAYFLQIRK